MELSCSSMYPRAGIVSNKSSKSSKERFGFIHRYTLRE